MPIIHILSRAVIVTSKLRGLKSVTPWGTTMVGAEGKMLRIWVSRLPENGLSSIFLGEENPICVFCLCGQKLLEYTLQYFPEHLATLLNGPRRSIFLNFLTWEIDGDKHVGRKFSKLDFENLKILLLKIIYWETNENVWHLYVIW